MLRKEHAPRAPVWAVLYRRREMVRRSHLKRRSDGIAPLLWLRGAGRGVRVPGVAWCLLDAVPSRIDAHHSLPAGVELGWVHVRVVLPCSKLADMTGRTRGGKFQCDCARAGGFRWTHGSPLAQPDDDGCPRPVWGRRPLDRTLV